jgi:hypothetical protein
MAAMTRISDNPATSPACSTAHGIESNDVPIIVFQTANLQKFKKELNVDYKLYLV